MSIQLKLWRLELYLVLGTVYQGIMTDMIQASCLRCGWNGRKVFALGPKPTPYGVK